MAVLNSAQILGQMAKNPPNIRLKKNREIDRSYLSLQQFDKFWIWPTCNDRKRKLCESAETWMEKFVKLTGYNYACNSLTNFEYEAHPMTGNGSHVNPLKLARKNSWNHIKWTYFWQVLAIWNHCGRVGQIIKSVHSLKPFFLEMDSSQHDVNNRHRSPKLLFMCK